MWRQLETSTWHSRSTSEYRVMVVKAQWVTHIFSKMTCNRHLQKCLRGSRASITMAHSF